MPEPSAIKLYLDEDTIQRKLIKALRARGVDVLTAQEAGLITASDEDHLEYATSQGRTLFTFNRGDFVKLHKEYLTASRHHAGIIVSNQDPVGPVVKRLLILLQARSAVEMEDWLEFLGSWR